MKRFSRILFYLRDQKGKIGLYVLFNFLSIIFSLVSLAMLAPFLQLLFNIEQLVTEKPVFEFTSTGLINYLKYLLSYLITNYGPVQALAAICITVIISVLFKNLF